MRTRPIASIAAGAAIICAALVTAGTPAASALAGSPGADRAGSAATITKKSLTSFGITQEPCHGTWGVQVITLNDASCISYGDIGETNYLGYYAADLISNNNYGSITFNKDLIEYNAPLTPCTVYQFNTGEFTSALLQFISIAGWNPGSCGNITPVSWGAGGVGP
jgi:hypothetical protein